MAQIEFLTKPVACAFNGGKMSLFSQMKERQGIHKIQYFASKKGIKLSKPNAKALYYKSSMRI